MPEVIPEVPASIAEAIKELAGEDGEFWKSDSEKNLRETAKKLLDLNVPEQTVIDTIYTVWMAASDEYGGQ
jgi:hypothetical protein